MAKFSPIVRKQLLEDLSKEKPTPSVWEEWLDGVAERHGLERKEVAKFYGRHLEMLEVQITFKSMSVAQQIASTLGVLRADAIRTLGAALKASRTRAVRIVNPEPEGARFEEVTEPDWNARIKAADALAQLYGMYAPQQIQVTHSVIEELRKLSDEDLHAQLAQRRIEAAAPPETDARPN